MTEHECTPGTAEVRVPEDALGRPLYGLLAAYADSGTLASASRAMWGAGYRCMDAYAPFPVEGLAEAVGARRTRLAWAVFAGGVAGAVGGLALQYYTSVVDYPINVGGRPLDSWPSFGVVAFELCILTAALVAVIGMLLRNGLPRPYHPAFNVPAFDRASTDGFFLEVQAVDPQFDPQRTRERLIELGAERVYEVPH